MFGIRDECEYCIHNKIKMDNATNKMVLLEKENKDLKELYIELKSNYDKNILQLSKIIEELNDLKTKKNKYTKNYNKIIEYIKWHSYLNEIPDFNIYCEYYEICGKDNKLAIIHQTFKNKYDWYYYMADRFPIDYIAYWRAMPSI